MKRRARLLIIPCVVVACSSTTTPNDSPSGDSGTQGATDGGAAPVDAGPPVPPITRAEQWVAGWYGTTSSRGTNMYSHVDAVGYPKGYYTQWIGDVGVTEFANVTDCSSFSDVLLTRAYGWQPPTQNARPLAEDYYWAITGAVRFQAIPAVADLQVGDVLALLYDASDVSGDSGHVAWIDALPTPFTGAPTETSLTEFAVTVIDSAHGFHYAPSANTANQDDRYLGSLTDGGTCSTDTDCITQYGAGAICNTTSLTNVATCAYTGVGRGQMRLYADASGNIAGYTWDTNSGSTFYGRPSPLPVKGTPFVGRDIVAGRYVGP